jgi:NAD(P)-dependent dehydrogenase (short-subunit alcohol dehydrogenase family)
MIAPYTSNEAVKQGIIQSIPLRRLGNPEDVAYTALFLASDEARFITGEELVVDGGQTIVI